MDENFKKISELEQEVRNLEASLTSTTSDIGDWKIAKYMEYQSVGEEFPYNIFELHEKRQAVRDRINALQDEVKTLNFTF